MTGRSAGTAGEATLGDPPDRVDEFLTGLEGRLPVAAPGAAGPDDRYASMATSARELVIVIEPGC